jgi:hypothetical protein
MRKAVVGVLATALLALAVPAQAADATPEAPGGRGEAGCADGISNEIYGEDGSIRAW